ncbi:hypothetical protein BG10_1555 [Bacillus thuringiensis serovar morrisoni]|nr:hypothetical protein BG10_1555 [Bacillus thuringiensis serovar morrisoni]MBG9640174.1 hypothetical protein [Bacillus thuringiensis]
MDETFKLVSDGYLLYHKSLFIIKILSVFLLMQFLFVQSEMLQVGESLLSVSRSLLENLPFLLFFLKRQQTCSNPDSTAYASARNSSFLPTTRNDKSATRCKTTCIPFNTTAARAANTATIGIRFDKTDRCHSY